MENRVGDSAPTPQKAADLLKKLNDIITELQKTGIILSVEERRSRLRARKDSEPHVQRVYDICKKHHVAIPHIPLDGMLADLHLADTLRPFGPAFTLGNQLIEDTTAQAETEMWQAFLQHYGVLQTLAEHNPEIAAELKPVVDFMRRKRSPTQPEPPTPPTPEDK